MHVIFLTSKLQPTFNLSFFKYNNHVAMCTIPAIKIYKARPEPGHLEWSGQGTGLVYNSLICHDNYDNYV